MPTEVHPNFLAAFPKSALLGLRPVSTSPGIQHGGFDQDEVKLKLGDKRFEKLMAQVEHVFSCGHRISPENNCEAHCIYAADLERFLQAGG